MTPGLIHVCHWTSYYNDHDCFAIRLVQPLQPRRQQQTQMQNLHSCLDCCMHLKEYSVFVDLLAVAAISLHIPCTILLVHIFGFAGGGYAVVVMRTAHFAFTVCKSLLILIDAGIVHWVARHCNSGGIESLRG